MNEWNQEQTKAEIPAAAPPDVPEPEMATVPMDVPEMVDVPVAAQRDPGSPPPGAGTPPPTRQPLPKRLVALCLVCALIGGAGSGALTAALMGGSFGGGDTVLYEGARTQVSLEQVSTAGERPLTVPEIYANYANACVGISVDIVTTNFFGQTVKGAAAGSGFVVSTDGYLVTNYHVVAQANAITVSFVDGSSYEARYVGGDEKNDVAVLKIEAEDLIPVILGDSSIMYVGEAVATIGNPLGELTFSLSDGVVSALDRSITLSDNTKMNMLQTNCTINAGNSGGPLFNLYGEVIGIVSAKYSSSGGVFTSEAAVEGLGFAIPINDVKSLIRDLIEKGYISGRPYLGVSVQTVSTAVQRYGIPAGAEVVYATPGLAAARADLREGDIITAVDDRQIDSSVALIDANNSFQAGDTAVFTVYRQGQTLEITVTFDEKTTQAEAAHNTYAAERDAEAAQNEPSGYNQGDGLPIIPYGDEDSYSGSWPFF